MPYTARLLLVFPLLYYTWVD